MNTDFTKLTTSFIRKKACPRHCLISSNQSLILLLLRIKIIDHQFLAQCYKIAVPRVQSQSGKSKKRSILNANSQ